MQARRAESRLQKRESDNPPAPKKFERIEGPNLVSAPRKAFAPRDDWFRPEVLAHRRIVCQISDVSTKSLAVILIRFFALILVLGGLLSLVGDVMTAWGKVGLVYWRTFLLTVVFPPVVQILFGGLILLFSRRLGGLICCGLEDKESFSKE